MSKHDFSELYARYPDIITGMPPVFTSHQFIVELARQNQRLYVEALYSYRAWGEPFKIVHGQLTKHLNQLTHLVRVVRTGLPSRNIFGQMGACAQWEKLPYRAPHGS